MRYSSSLILFVFVTAAACDGSKEAPPAPETQAPTAAPSPSPTAAAPAAASSAAAEAQTIFSQRCSVCHGNTGKGDGPGAAALNPKPRNYSDAAWQKSVTDDDLKKIIVQGGQAVGKSMMMPPNPDLTEKPEVVAELVKIVRGFAGK